MYNVDARGTVISALSQRFPCPQVQSVQNKGYLFSSYHQNTDRPAVCTTRLSTINISHPPHIFSSRSTRVLSPKEYLTAPPTKTPHPRYSPPRDTDSSSSPSDTPPAPPSHTPPTAPWSPSRSLRAPPPAAQTPRCPRVRPSPARLSGIARRGGCCRWRVPRRFARGRRCV